MKLLDEKVKDANCRKILENILNNNDIITKVRYSIKQ